MNPLNEPNVALDLCQYLKSKLPTLDIIQGLPENERECVTVNNTPSPVYGNPYTRYRVEIRVLLSKGKTFEDGRKVMRQINNELWTYNSIKVDKRGSKLWKIVPTGDTAELYDEKRNCIVLADLFVYLS